MSEYMQPEEINSGIETKDKRGASAGSTRTLFSTGDAPAATST